MLSHTTTISKYSFDAETEDGEIKAPRPRPLESDELPPEFKLEEQDLCAELGAKLSLESRGGGGGITRKGSLDMHYSILGFINRKIREKSRQRIMSEEIGHYQF